MTRALCRAVVRASALLAPRRLRARWREEWLAEIQAARISTARLMARVGGAPLDALLLHWTPSTNMSVRNGWTADFRDAWRALIKTPLQTITMIGCLAVGAALMVAVFAAGNALVAGEQPGIGNRGSLFFLERKTTRESSSLNNGHYLSIDWNRMPPGVQSAGAEMPTRFDIVVNGLPQRVRGSLVGGGFFETLGTTPQLGRLIARDDEAPAAPAVAVISHGFWQRALAGRPDIVGQTMRIGMRPVEIIGVTPPGFVGMRIGELGNGPDSDEDVWMVLRKSSLHARGPGFRSSVGPQVVVRVSPGTTREAAEASLAAFISRLQEEDLHDKTEGVRLLPFRYAELHEVSNGLPLFFSALLFIPTLVLLIGAANVASLQAARAAWRVHEFSVRASLGATRLRLARLLGIETAILAVAATAIAWGLATATLRYGASLLPFVVTPDWRVLLFSLGIPVVITLLIGITPSWRATGVDVLAGLRLGGRSGQGGRGRLRRLVVSAQIAVSVALVLASLVLARAIVTGPMGTARKSSDVLVAGFYQTTIPETDRRPALRALMAGLSTMAAPHDIAFSSGEVRWIGSWFLGDKPDPRDPSRWVAGRHATSSIFGLLGVQLIEGRLYDDTESSVMVVNQAFVRRHSLDRPVLGSVHRVKPSGMLIMNAKGEWVDAAGAHLTEDLRVVGVVSDGFERDSRGRVKAAVYAPMDITRMQSFAVFMRPGNIGDAQRRIRELAATVAPAGAPDPLATISALTEQEFRGPRWVSRVLGYAGSLALLLACVGLFALISTAVAQRRHEYAVRVALGADRRDIIRLVLGDASLLTAIGLVFGFVLAVPAWIVIRDDVAAHATMFDPWAMLTVIGSLAAAAAAAAFLPARRAGAADPLTALRGD